MDLANGWINAYEATEEDYKRLREYTGHALVYEKSDNREIGAHYLVAQLTQIGWLIRGGEEIDVSHWMPLPESPKEKE